MQYVKPKYISLKANSEFNEKWIQKLIADDPGILGLGDLSLMYREKSLPGGGRVDFILGDDESSVRYEVELQLGKTDPSHIIRVLEYWDIEKKRHPQYDHVAVLIAEDITARFFNVISLFNGVVPIIALQVKCVEIEGKVTLVFSKILDLMVLGDEKESPGEKRAFNRDYWIKREGEEVLILADNLLSAVNSIPEINGKAELEYGKGQIRIVHSGMALAYCVPNKRNEYVRVAVKLSRSTDMDKYLSDSELDVMEYAPKLGRYRIRMHVGEDNDYPAITELIKAGLSDREM